MRADMLHLFPKKKHFPQGLEADNFGNCLLSSAEYWTAYASSYLVMRWLLLSMKKECLPSGLL